jgi:hypothetical protein
VPEVIIPDKYADQIPRFVLPKELTNPDVSRETSEVKPEVKPEKPAEPVKTDEAKPATEAVATEPEKKADLKTGEVTTGKDPEKATTRRFERRIDRAHRRAAEAQARAEALEREIAEIRAKSVPVVDTEAPKMENFTDVNEFKDASVAHAVKKALEERDHKQREESTKTAQAQLVSKWEEKVAEAQDKYDDWDEMVGQLKPTTPWSIAIHKTDNGVDVAYHLGSHPAEAKKLFALDPYDQILEVAKLSHKLSATPDKPKEPSKAPAPITPVTGEATVSDMELAPVMPFEKYRKIGNKMFRGNR